MKRSFKNLTALFAFCRKSDGWVVRDDVLINYLDRRGKLTVGYGAPGKNLEIGPELGFGFTFGDKYEEPVLLIKTAWGGRSLARETSGADNHLEPRS
jgi:alpha-galactosidase